MSLTLDQAFRTELERVIRSPRLLVASDFDGTISSFAVDPAAAEIHPISGVALRKLLELPQTEVAVVSGRALSELHARFGSFERIRLVGSHGGEFDLGVVTRLSDEQAGSLERAVELMNAACAMVPGSLTEHKPHAVVWHFRGADESAAAAEYERLIIELEALGGVLRKGSCVLEYGVAVSDKGAALERLREQLSPAAILFIGDDVTDEDAFRVLGNTHLSIKVGEGPTAARFRVQDTDEVASVLAFVAEERQRWFGAHPETEIHEHSMLSDLRTVAILDQDSMVVWLCAPRLDSPPLFGSLVAGTAAGYFKLVGAGSPTRRYLDDSMVLETTWDGITVTDFLACEAGRPFQRAGRSDLRRVIRGTGTVSVEFAPRRDFGQLPTRLSKVGNGLRIEGGQYPAVLHAPGWEWEIIREGVHDTARATRLLQGETVYLDLLLGTASCAIPLMVPETSLDQTTRFWRMWVQSLQVPPHYREPLVRSALVLRALCHGPTGAIAAAATTSLPETIGGVRNWDYRFCWPRDASLAATAVAKLGSHGPGIRFLDWLLDIVDRNSGDMFLAPIYSISGGHLTNEAEIRDAPGYRGSRPVRVGNLAAHQLQLDVLGPIAELLAELAKRGAPLAPEHLGFAEQMVNLVQARWQEPDSGIWEIRDAPRHYVHSKVMCWYVADQALRMTHALGVERPEWQRLAEEIRTDIETNGFVAEKNTYGAAYGYDEPDAAVLCILLCRFHEAQHPRSLGTVAYIKEHLLKDSSVYRYNFDDGLPGKEGSFHICLAWLIEALAMQGDLKEAKSLCDAMLGRMSSLGFLSEQWDPEHGSLGNFPQAYSHLGVINAVLSIVSAEGGSIADTQSGAQ